MSLEEQLGKLNANLEVLVAVLTLNGATGTLETRNTPLVEPKAKAFTANKENKPESEEKQKAKTEPKEEQKPEAETTSEGVTFEFLADKVRALAALDREAARAVFASLNVKGLSAVDPKDYVKVDLALTKALNKANAAKEEG